MGWWRLFEWLEERVPFLAERKLYKAYKDYKTASDAAASATRDCVQVHYTLSVTPYISEEERMREYVNSIKEKGGAKGHGIRN